MGCRQLFLLSAANNSLQSRARTPFFPCRWVASFFSVVHLALLFRCAAKFWVQARHKRTHESCSVSISNQTTKPQFDKNKTQDYSQLKQSRFFPQPLATTDSLAEVQEAGSKPSRHTHTGRM